MSRGLRRWTADWWAGGGGAIGAVLDRALLPAEALFAAGSALRNRAYDRGWLPSARAEIPVISIGNLSVGGVGKTPFTAWVAGQLESWGRAPAIVLRGYGGDEVLVHRELNPAIPVFAAPRRADGVARAAAAGRDVAVLDDGFQHRALARDLDVVLLSAETWDGEHRLLPRGPWRESISALARASAIVVTRKTATADASREIATRVHAARPGVAVATCHLAPGELAPLHGSAAPSRPESLRGERIVAVASLGDPGAFARQLEMMGAEVELIAYPDHHAFDGADAREIESRAGGRPVVMTRKEAVKLRSLLPAGTPALVLGQRAEMELGREALLQRLRQAVEG
jgi:tetraacyldisaccharide 4'-kinase